MSPHRALIRSLAGNAPAWEPDQVVSFAVEALALEAESLAESGECKAPAMTRLLALAGRLRALEAYVDCLEISYQQKHEDDFAFDGETSDAPAAESDGAR